MMFEWISVFILGILLCPYATIALFVILFGRRKTMDIHSGNENENLSILLSISAYIPTMNEEKTIAKKIEDVMSQSCIPNEILIYDCSTDQTPSIIEQYQRKFPQIRLIRQPSRIGMAETFNQAIRDAKGDILLRTDADVSFKSRDAIKMSLAAFSDPSIGAVCGSYVRQSGMEKYYRLFMTKIQIAESNLDSTVIAHSGLLAFRRIALSPVDPNSMAEDTEEFIRIRKNGLRTKILPHIEIEEEIAPNFALRRKQRDRRALGVMRAIFQNRKMLFNRKYGRYGTLILPLEIFILGISPFVSVAILATVCYLSLSISPFFLALFALPALLLAAKSAAILTAVDTQISGLVATSKLLLNKQQPLWTKVR